MTTFFGCNTDIVCGHPEGKKKAFIDSVNSKFKDNLVIKDVPCYSDYMQLDLKNDYDKNIIDSIEKAYIETVNYAEFMVYDKNGKLIRGNIGSM
jgi:hypothetical protein